MAIEKGIVELKHQKEEAQEDKKKEFQREIKRAEESVKAMKIAKRNLRKFMSSFEEGLAQVTK